MSVFFPKMSSVWTNKNTGENAEVVGLDYPCETNRSILVITYQTEDNKHHRCASNIWTQHWE